MDKLLNLDLEIIIEEYRDKDPGVIEEEDEDDEEDDMSHHFSEQSRS